MWQFQLGNLSNENRRSDHWKLNFITLGCAFSDRFAKKIVYFIFTFVSSLDIDF